MRRRVDIPKKLTWQLIMEPRNPFIDKAEQDFNEFIGFTSKAIRLDYLSKEVVSNYTKLVASYYRAAFSLHFEAVKELRDANYNMDNLKEDENLVLNSEKPELQNTLFEDFIFEFREPKITILETKAMDAESILEDKPDCEVSKKTIKFIKGVFKDIFYEDENTHLSRLEKLIEKADSDISLYKDTILLAMKEVLESYIEFKEPSLSPAITSHHSTRSNILPSIAEI